jgi:hypothetical protein
VRDGAGISNNRAILESGSCSGANPLPTAVSGWLETISFTKPINNQAT